MPPRASRAGKSNIKRHHAFLTTVIPDHSYWLTAFSISSVSGHSPHCILLLVISIERQGKLSTINLFRTELQMASISNHWGKKKKNILPRLQSSQGHQIQERGVFVALFGLDQHIQTMHTAKISLTITHYSLSFYWTVLGMEWYETSNWSSVLWLF